MEKPMNHSSVISVVTVINNPAMQIDSYLKKLTSILSDAFSHYEILFVFYDLPMSAQSILKNKVSAYKKIRLIQLANNCDDDIAYNAGLNSAIGDAVVLIDLHQDPIELIPQLLFKILNEEADVVAGNNLTKYRTSLALHLLEKSLVMSARILCKQTIDFDRTYFSCYSRTAINSIIQYKNNVRNLRLLSQLLGLETLYISYTGLRQTNTPPLLSLKRLFSRIEEVFNLSVRPLRIAAAACFCVGTLNIVYIFYILYIKLFSTATPGWAALSMEQSLASIILFLALGTQLIYTNIISQEIKRKPLYNIINEWFSENSIYTCTTKNVIDNQNVK